MLVMRSGKRINIASIPHVKPKVINKKGTSELKGIRELWNAGVLNFINLLKLTD